MYPQSGPAEKHVGLHNNGAWFLLNVPIEGKSVDKIMQCTDKFGWPFAIEECGKERREEIIEMYEIFSPKPIAQGLPPLDDAERLAWIDKLLVCGRNFLAWQEGRVVGHASLVADFDRQDAEYIIFVDQPYRNRGLGSELSALAVETARKLGLQSLWLTVESYNFRAIRVYRKVGFQFCDECERERVMILRL